MAEIKIFVTNLGKYNEGELIGEWLELPATDEEIAATLERIGISDKPDALGRYYEEYFITDYESDIDGFTCGEYESISNLNEIAEALTDADPEQVAAALYFSSSFEEAANILDDVIYITTPSGCESEEEAVGYYYAEEIGCLDIPENLKSYFDYEKYGRDIMLEGSFYTAESGKIYECMR